MLHLQPHHFLASTSSSSSTSSSRGSSGDMLASHPLETELGPSTSAGARGHLSASTSSTPLAVQRPGTSNANNMYRLSSFRPSSLGIVGGGPGGPGSMDSPTGTPLAEVVNAQGPSSSQQQHFLHRQSSQTDGSGQSPPSSATTNVPTYETIDVGNLSHHHLTGYNPTASTLDYSSSASGHSGTSACGLDSSTAPIMGVPLEAQRALYGPYGPLILGRGPSGPGYLSRNRPYPHPTSDGSAYYSIYGCGYNGRSSETSGIYSPTRRRPEFHGHHQQGHRKDVLDECEADFDIANAIFALVSLTTFLTSLGASLALAYFFHHHEHDMILFGLTLGATLVPAVIVNILSLKWLLNDNHRQQKDPDYPVKRPDIGPCGWTARILLHICLLGPALRYVDLLRFGVASWSEKRRLEEHKAANGTFWPTTTLPSLSTTLPRARYLTGDGLPAFDPPPAPTSATPSRTTSAPPIDYYMLTVYEDRDSSLLSLFRALLQCTVQLVVQLWSLLHHYQLEHVHNHSSEYNHQFTEYVQLTVICCSLFELAWSLASYHRSLRRASLGKRAMTAIGMMLQFIWHLGTTGARLLAVALFISQYGAWLAPITIGHWGVMTVWIMHQGTHFMDDPHHLSEYLFSMLVGAIYLVQFLNVKDEPTRYKYSWYYAIVALEDILLAIAWAIRISESAELEFFWLRIPAVLTVVVSFAIGILAMQLYYWCAHPSGRPLWVNKAARCC